MDDLVHQGKVRYIGCSNFVAWQVCKALWTSDKLNLARFESVQPHYNLVHRAEFERELMPLCQAEGLGVIPYSPLQGGFLTGKYRMGQAAPKGSRGGTSQLGSPRRRSMLSNALREAWDRAECARPSGRYARAQARHANPSDVACGPSRDRA